MVEEQEEDIREVPLRTPPNKLKPLAQHPDINHAIRELKDGWLQDVLIEAGLSEDQYLDPNSDETLDAMVDLQLEVYKCNNGELAVKQSGVFIGEWAEPEIRAFQDNDGQWFAHLLLNYWP